LSPWWPGAPLFSRIETGARVASAFYRRRVILTVISSPTVYLGSVLNILHRGKIMTRLVTYALFVCLTSSVALGQTPRKQLLIYRTEHDARRHCHNDTIVWADTKTHALYLPGDDHYAHTHGGYTCDFTVWIWRDRIGIILDSFSDLAYHSTKLHPEHRRASHNEPRSEHPCPFRANSCFAAEIPWHAAGIPRELMSNVLICHVIKPRWPPETGKSGAIF
jgi:hypothetical protein